MHGRRDAYRLPKIVLSVHCKGPLPFRPPFGMKHTAFEQILQGLHQVEWLPMRFSVQPLGEVGGGRRQDGQHHLHRLTFP